MSRGAKNSLGKPWAGERWRCTACGETGEGRDDRALSLCSAHPSRGSGATHVFAYSPPEHHAAVLARYRGHKIAPYLAEVSS